MPWKGVPWMVNGAKHDAALGRAVTYGLSGGGEGVGYGTDCKVMQSSVVDNKIHIMPGVATMLNRYPGGARQSYVGYAPSEDVPTVPPTTGSARSDLVVARIVDRDFGGQQPVNVDDGPYMFTEIITNVPSTTKRFSDLGLAYPAVELARVDRPAGTNTVSQGQITDLRKLTSPRRERTIQNRATGLNDFILMHDQTAWATALNWQPQVFIPTWASTLLVRMDLAGLVMDRGAVWGEVRLAISDGSGGVSTPPVVFDQQNYNADLGDLQNFDITIACTVPQSDIASFRGKTATVFIEAHMLAVMSSNMWTTARGATFILDAEVVEGLQ